MRSSIPQFRWGTAHVVRSVLALVIVVLLLAAAGEAAVHTPPSAGPGTIREPANGSTVIAVQGYNIGGNVNPNKPARLLSVGPEGDAQWDVSGSEFDVSWFYDVDPLPDDDLLVVGTVGQRTRVLRIDRSTQEVKWRETLPLWDTHDVTLTERGNLLIAHMRNTQNGTSNDRVYVYNRTTDAVEWEWQFKNHYANDTDVGISAGDWTHVNDVDVVAPGLYMLSPRNFDQVIVVNRSTKDVVMRLGADGNHSILDEQHNPAYLQDDAGRPTLLVADSENDRVVEYACDRGDPDHPLDGDMKPNCDWSMTWEVGVDTLSWPRDADRLPNGNTLITDTINHRVVEITPRGDVVWSYHAPWLPFDAERPVHGQEAGGPTMADQNVTGSYTIEQDALSDAVVDRSLPQRVELAVASLPGGGLLASGLDTYQGVAPWVRPVWFGPDGFFLGVVAVLIALCWGVAELVVARSRVVAGVRASLAPWIGSAENNK
ncbi:aryl-sulfate sulfotransferase [Halorientalis brevis]|uniref:Aryl-sulfate sulfotransferase n=1 Tax=Halorientalis brevis TaxID=1126241 RepID=A0ABD6C5F5_9EURY|nr:aryl-sulfate sulfotransferase [Halorientalis brevis]